MMPHPTSHRHHTRPPGWTGRRCVTWPFAGRGAKDPPGNGAARDVRVTPAGVFLRL